MEPNEDGLSMTRDMNAGNQFGLEDDRMGLLVASGPIEVAIVSDEEAQVINQPNEESVDLDHLKAHLNQGTIMRVTKH